MTIQSNVVAFIPWNITLFNACAKQDQYVLQNSNKVNHFQLDMRFTYGQMYGLNTVLSCFREIALEHNINVTIDGMYTTNYTIAKFEVQGERSAKNEFYKLLANRKKSVKCIEYICIAWNMDMVVQDPDSDKKKDAIMVVGLVLKKLIDLIKLFHKSVHNYSYLNTKRADSSMQKSIVYIVAIAVAALLLITAGVFVFKTHQAKPQKDLCTDQSVLRKWSNEN